MYPIFIRLIILRFIQIKSVVFGLVVVFLTACTTNSSLSPQDHAEFEAHQVDDLFIVDCLLPGQIRRLGTGMTYLTQRRPTKTSAVDCRVRGGEYVAYDRANYATALKTWLPRAQQNEAEAQAYVGEIYEKGYGLEPDYILAAQWYEKAAQQGNSRAQINLGYLYERGLGVEQNLVTALNWYKKASGLESEDLAFASTVESAVRSEYQAEMDLLRNELDRSKQEIKALRASLKKTDQQLNNGKSKLKQLQLDLNQSQGQYNQIQQSATPDSSKLVEQKRLLEVREAKVAEQYQEVQRLENELNQQNNFLSSKLIEAENRTSQLDRELSAQQLQKGQLSQELTTLQTQLKQSNAELEQLTGQFNSQKFKIEQEKVQLAQIKQQAQMEGSAQLQALSNQIVAKDKQLADSRLQIKQLKQTQAEIIAEKKALQSRHGETISTQDKTLVDLNKQLIGQEQALQQQELKISQLVREKNQIKLDAKQLQSQSNQDVSKKTENIQVLESQLSDRELANEQLRQQMLQLEKERQAYQKKLALTPIPEATQVVFAPPSIEIIEPPLTVTRSSSLPTIKLRSNVKKREITGRVTAPAGLFTLNVNGQKKKVNDSGIFNAMISLKGKETEVNTVAIDKKGKKSSLDFMLLAANDNSLENRKQSVPVNKKSKRPHYDIDFGPYYALIIGNEQYSDLPLLDTPVNDAKAVNKILKEKYGFNTTLILNADRYTILSQLNKLRAKLTEVDNLLIYYAGHGELDRVNLRGHWLPVDAESGNTANWISTIAITDIINAMSARHVLVVADSCYSGAMTRSSLARLESGMSDSLRMKWLKVMSKTRSRTVLTSGGLKPVLDSGINGHSIFANAFLESLNDNEGILEGQDLFRRVSGHIQKSSKRLNFQQVPEYAPIRHGGHEAGDFFFRDLQV